MGVRLGEISSILNRADPGAGMGAFMDGMDAIRQAGRDQEQDRAQGVLEGQRDRQQTETERAGQDLSAQKTRRQDEVEEQADLKRRYEGFEGAVKFMSQGMGNEAAAWAKLHGMDLEKTSPEDFKKEHEEVRTLVAAEEKRIAAEQATAQAEQAGEEIDAWVGEADNVIDDIIGDPGRKRDKDLEFYTRQDEPTKGEGTGYDRLPLSDEQVGDVMAFADPGGGMEQVLGRDEVMAMAQADATGMKRDQAQQQAAAQALALIQPQQQAMGAAMGMPPQQPPASPGMDFTQDPAYLAGGMPGDPMQQTAQMMQPQQQAMTAAMGMPQMGAPPMAPAGPSPTAMQMGIGGEQFTLDPQAAMAAEKQRRIAEAVPHIRDLVGGMAESAQPSEQEAYREVGRQVEAALQITGDPIAAVDMALDDTVRQQMERLGKTAANEAAVKAARAKARRTGGIDVDKRYESAHKMVSATAKKHGYEVHVKNLRTIDKAKELLTSDSPNSHTAGMNILARAVAGEKGPMTEGDIRRAKGEMSLFSTINAWVNRWRKGGLDTNQRRNMVTTLGEASDSARRNVRSAYGHTERAAKNQRRRSGDHGSGANAAMLEHFAPESDSYVEFLDEETMSAPWREGNSMAAPAATPTPATSESEWTTVLVTGG